MNDTARELDYGVFASSRLLDRLANYLDTERAKAHADAAELLRIHSIAASFPGTIFTAGSLRHAAAAGIEKLLGRHQEAQMFADAARTEAIQELRSLLEENKKLKAELESWKQTNHANTAGAIESIAQLADLRCSECGDRLGVSTGNPREVIPCHCKSAALKDAIQRSDQYGETCRELRRKLKSETECNKAREEYWADRARASERVMLAAIRDLEAEVDHFRSAIALHRSQLADDRCIEDDDRLYKALGDGIKYYTACITTQLTAAGPQQKGR